MACQNELCDRVADLARKYFTLFHVRNYPLIFAGCNVKRSKSKPASTKGKTVPHDTFMIEATEQKGDLLICDLW